MVNYPFFDIINLEDCDFFENVIKTKKLLISLLDLFMQTN